MSFTLASFGFDVTIITAYAPHSNYDTEVKENFYDIMIAPQMKLCLFMGDTVSVEISMPAFILSGKPIRTFVVPIS